MSRLGAAEGIDAPEMMPGAAQTSPSAMAAHRPWGQWHDQYAGLLAGRDGAAPIISSLLPRLSAWFEVGDQALQGERTPAVGYAGLGGGAGEMLSLLEPEADLTPPLSAQPHMDVTSTPAWLTPAVAPRLSAASPSKALMASMPPRIAQTDGILTAMPAEIAAKAPTSLQPGVVGLSAVGVISRLAERHFAGIEPIAAVSTAPTSVWTQPLLSGLSDTGEVGLQRFVESYARAGSAPAFGLEPRWWQQIGTPVAAPTRPFAGGLLDDSGAGEWLLPGDEGYEQWLQQAHDRDVAAAPLKPPTAGREPRQTAKPAKPALARAAVAAIDSVVSTHDRLQRPGIQAPAAASASPSLLDWAAAGPRSVTDEVLGLSPGGAADVVTPWLLQGALDKLPAETRRAMRIADAWQGDLVSLQSDSEVAIDTLATVSERGGARIVAHRVQRQQAAIMQALARPAMRKQLQKLGVGAMDLREPAALQAAMALFGESPSADVRPEAAQAFLSRFFGRVQSPRKISPSAEGELLSLSPELGRPLTTAADRAMSPEPAAEKQVVFEGLAGLAALRHMKSADVVEPELLALGKIEDMPSATPDAARTATGLAASGTKVAAQDRRAGSVRLHEFAPLALARGRGLLSKGRRRGGRILRHTRRGRLGRSRVGYGSAGLGGGPLVGLGSADQGASFHGGDFGHTGTVQRAERLSAAVQSRRGLEPGPVGRVLRPRAGGAVERTMAPGGPGLGRDAQLGSGGELVSPQQAIQSAAAGAPSRQGATAQAKSVKAGAMARVLSVTAAPSANILPLVAPAARAIAAQAAAKPQAESIATSGADSTHASSSRSVAGGGGSETGQTDATKQDLDALAMKIARSVLVRMKREKERRGIHG